MKPITLKQHEVIHLRDTGAVIAWRVVKPQPVPFRSIPGDPHNQKPWMQIGGVQQDQWICHYGRTGEERWVKESGYWIQENGKPYVTYRADGERKPPGCSWMPSCTMPRWASRFTVTLDVGVKRRHEVTEEEAKMSGASGDCPVGYIPYHQKGPCRYHLSQIMDSIGCDRAWSRNDYFWKITCTLKK